jgi:thiamine-monophosphate kinase
MRSERELIRHIAALARGIAPAPARSAVIQGIGDDCAVLRLGPGSDTLITTDLFVEGVHFRREWFAPDFLGYRCLTRGLSDIAAMGGEAVAVFLSLSIPADLDFDWFDDFLRGFLVLAQAHRVTLAGGDTGTSTAGVVADVVALGRVPTGKALLRSSAHPGDALYVTGKLGESALMIESQQLGSSAEPTVFVPPPSSPRPRVRKKTSVRDLPPRLTVGHRLHGVASAMIDVSDGLSTDLAHICEGSGVGAIVYESEVPRYRAKYTPGFNPHMLELALHGGEDYELLFTAPRNRKVPSVIAGVPITRIGEITADEGKMWLVDARGNMKPLEPKGWEHFTARGTPSKPASRAAKRGRR